MRKARFVAVAVLMLSLTVAATPSSSNAGDPYVVSVQSENRPDGSVTVDLSVTERATNTVVFAPRINTRPGIPAEATTHGDDGRSFEAGITVDQAGKVTVVFKAYERLVQRSVIRT